LHGFVLQDHRHGFWFRHLGLRHLECFHVGVLKGREGGPPGLGVGSFSGNVRVPDGRKPKQSLGALDSVKADLVEFLDGFDLGGNVVGGIGVLVVGNGGASWWLRIVLLLLLLLLLLLRYCVLGGFVVAAFGGNSNGVAHRVAVLWWLCLCLCDRAFVGRIE